MAFRIPSPNRPPTDQGAGGEDRGVGRVTAAAKGLWSLIFLIALILGLAFALPLLIHLLILLPQLGWEAVA